MMAFIFIQLFSIIFMFVSPSNPTLLLYMQGTAYSHRNNTANEEDAFHEYRL